jgi:hypothetical protein
MQGWMHSPSRGTPCASDCPLTTNNGEVACSLPRRDWTVGSYGTV